VRREDVLAQLDAPVARVVPCGGRHLAYLSGGQIQAVDLESRDVTVVRATTADLSVDRSPEWQMRGAEPCRILTVWPSPRFNDLAFANSARACRANAGGPPAPVSTDIIGLVGFGPWRWPRRAVSPPVPKAPGAPRSLQARDMAPAEGPLAQAFVFVDGRTYAVMADGHLAERPHSVMRRA